MKKVSIQKLSKLQKGILGWTFAVMSSPYCQKRGLVREKKSDQNVCVKLRALKLIFQYAQTGKTSSTGAKNVSFSRAVKRLWIRELLCEYNLIWIDPNRSQQNTHIALTREGLEIAKKFCTEDMIRRTEEIADNLSL